MAKTKKSGWVNRAALAQAFGVTRSTVTRWEADGMPSQRSARGRETLFNLVKCKAWRAAADASGGANDGGLRQARARKELAQALESEQRVAIKAGKLVDAEEVRQAIADDYSRVRTKLLGLARKAKAALPHLSITDVQAIDAAIREALTELADGDYSHG